MSTAESRPIRIESNDGEATTGTLHITKYSHKERVLRAVKVLALMWALAAAAVLIPIAHFVLVPGFFVAGPVMAFMRYRVTDHPDNATGECPVCKEAMEISLEPNAHLPLWTYCPASNDPIQLREIDRAPGSGTRGE